MDIYYSYTQELPTRFKKELLQAACRTSSTDNNDRIVQEGMQRVLANIGASDRVSAAEIKSIFDELGNDKGEIVSQKLMQILWDGTMKHNKTPEYTTL